MKENKKLRFGVIGTSAIADKVLTSAKFDSRFELVAVYSRKQETANFFAQKHGAKHTFTSLEMMAKSDVLDAVYIASPNSLHASQSILMMKNGKHVICEKPFASNAKEVKQMIEVARENNVTLMEAMKPPLTPNFAKVLENIHEIGEIRRYTSAYCQYSSRYDDLKKGIVQNAFKPELSNGATMDIGVYTIYPMVVLFGRPNKIMATGLNLSTGVDGHGAVNFEYDNMIATVMYSKIANSFLPTEIQGEHKSILMDKIGMIEEVVIQDREGMKPIGVPFEMEKEYYHEIFEFINLVQTGKIESDIVSHKNSLLTMEIMDEIRRQLGVVYPADSN